MNTSVIKNYSLEEYLTKSITHFSPYDKVEPTVFIYYAKNKFIAQQYIKLNDSPIFVRRVDADTIKELFANLNYTGTENLDNLDIALKAVGHSKVNSIYLIGGNKICNLYVKTLLKGTKRICKIGELDIDEFLKYTNTRMGEYIQNSFKITPNHCDMVR